jgi:hypothetical protein
MITDEMVLFAVEAVEKKRLNMGDAAKVVLLRHDLPDAEFRNAYIAVDRVLYARTYNRPCPAPPAFLDETMYELGR